MRNMLGEILLWLRGIAYGPQDHILFQKEAAGRQLGGKNEDRSISRLGEFQNTWKKTPWEKCELPALCQVGAQAIIIWIFHGKIVVFWGHGLFKINYLNYTVIYPLSKNKKSYISRRTYTHVQINSYLGIEKYISVFKIFH